MKTYYFTGRWQNVRESGGGYSSEREELHVEFLKLEEDGVLIKDFVWKGDTNYYTVDVYFEVYEYEAGQEPPEWVLESIDWIATSWLQKELNKLGVTIKIISEESK